MISNKDNSHLQNLTEEFVVGDGHRYGKYFNAPLQSTGDYHVSLGVVSSLHGNTKVSYAYATHSQHGVMILDIPVEGENILSYYCTC